VSRWCDALRSRNRPGFARTRSEAGVAQRGQHVVLERHTFVEGDVSRAVEGLSSTTMSDSFWWCAQRVRGDRRSWTLLTGWVIGGGKTCAGANNAFVLRGRPGIRAKIDILGSPRRGSGCRRPVRARCPARSANRPNTTVGVARERPENPCSSTPLSPGRVGDSA